jgi:TRAP-type C4-dicarboxylate transport system substrate-binding protein
MIRYISTFGLAVLLLLSSTIELYAGPKHLFKIASLAPAGSVWVNQFEKFADDISKESGGEIGFRIYPGGVMGDDQAMFRKMRVGQLHGGGLTMTGISRKVPDFRVMAIPFLFESYEEVDYVNAGLLSDFREQFQQQGFEFISMTEVGFIYAMSTHNISSFKAFKESKNWSPSGDPISDKYMANLDITPVQLSIPDVMASLQSGLIDTVYNSLYGSIVMQWFTKTKYIVDFPYGYAYGVFVLSSKKFNKLTDAQKQIVNKAAGKHFPILLEKTRQSNKESHKVLQERGNTFVHLDDESAEILRRKRDETVKQLVPEAFSQEIQDKAFKLLDEFRNK